MKKALVVDDTKNIRTLLTTCLELNGYTVSTASSGDEALNLFKTKTFDLVFLDIKMPEISGTEVLRRIRSMGIDIPVVIMTAFATVKNAVECTKLGAVAYLQKPFTTDKVKALLKELEHNNEEEPTAKSYITSAKKLLDEGKIDEAYNYLKMALSIEPDRSECYELIGKVHELKGDINQAKKFYAVASEFKV
jgi:DNA-binding NtrC family response regulator